MLREPQSSATKWIIAQEQNSEVDAFSKRVALEVLMLGRHRGQVPISTHRQSREEQPFAPRKRSNSFGNCAAEIWGVPCWGRSSRAALRPCSAVPALPHTGPAATHAGAVISCCAKLGFWEVAPVSLIPVIKVFLHCVICVLTLLISAVCLPGGRCEGWKAEA